MKIRPVAVVVIEIVVGIAILLRVDRGEVPLEGQTTAAPGPASAG